MSTVVVSGHKGPGCFTQALWFLFIGWWAGAIWISLAWLLMVTIIGIPIAVMMINRLPKVIALREPGAGVTVIKTGDVTVIDVSGKVPQHNILVRAIYFLFIGIWLSAIWMGIAYLFCLTIIGMPVGFWMFEKTPAVLSLRR
jgi:uncharacterized membrane protein YccF (DUF307 family)